MMIMVYIYIYIYIYIYFHHHQIVMLARISLTLTLAIYPSHQSLPTGLLDSTLCLYIVAVGRFLLVDQHWHVNVKEPLRERHLLVDPCFLICPTCLILVISMVLERGDKMPYSCSFVRCLPGFVQYCSKHSCSVSVLIFHYKFSWVHVVHL